MLCGSANGAAVVGMVVEGETIKAIRLERHSFTAGRPDSELIKVVQYPVTSLDTHQGAVIDGVPGHDAIVLRGDLSGPPGKLEISYLYNGLTGEYHTCKMGLDRSSNTGWRLVNRLDQTISMIGVRIRQIPVIGTVGIANLEGACT